LGKPRIFISHCESNIEPTNYAIQIIHNIGCIPVVAEIEPKLSKTVPTLVSGKMESCDVVLIIATPDRVHNKEKEPSQSVCLEIGNVQKMERFKEKYFIIKEETTYLGPLIPETHYRFSMNDFSQIAIAILTEMRGMEYFKNYYEMQGSELNLDKLMVICFQLKELQKNGVLTLQEILKKIDEEIRKRIDDITGGVH